MYRGGARRRRLSTRAPEVRDFGTGYDLIQRNGCVALIFGLSWFHSIDSRTTTFEDCTMIKTRNVLLALVPIAALSLAPMSPAMAYGHGGGYGHGRGFGPIGFVAAAVVGTAAAIVTAPFVIAASVARPVAVAPGYYPPPAVYYPPAPVYAVPPAAYAPPAYYAPGYYPPPAYYPAR